jgi:acetyltransferase-like isoleucine patch superfamily enzyme
MKKRFGKWHNPIIREKKLTRWNWMVQGAKKLTVGKNVDIGAFSYINAQCGVILEDDVQIGSHCSLYSVSTIDSKKGRIILKRNAKIGSHSVVMPGVSIGKNSTVGAFSFVTKNIPDNVVAVGIPAKVIKKVKE